MKPAVHDPDSNELRDSLPLFIPCAAGEHKLWLVKTIGPYECIYRLLPTQYWFLTKAEVNTSTLDDCTAFSVFVSLA